MLASANGVIDKSEKHFLAIEDGQCENKMSWSEVLGDLKRRGMNMPRLAVGDGALGFRTALAELFPQTKTQCCWVHKSKHILNWISLWTTIPFESTFATIRHRSQQSRGCCSRMTILKMVFKLSGSAQKNWRRMTGSGQLPLVVHGIQFQDGVEAIPNMAATLPIGKANSLMH